MKVKIDKMPDKPEECLFSTPSRSKNCSGYTACKLNKNRICDDTSICEYLKVDDDSRNKEIETEKKDIDIPITAMTYQIHAMRTADPKLTKEKALLEGLVGMNSESGEALDIWKKYEFQGHELDRRAIALELGDALWYLTEAARALGYDLGEIMKMNIVKLAERYPDGFDPEKSKNRKVLNNV